ncbi:hypothetical protein HPC62_16210 [Thermoleptolyngbya sichuanensis A183]|uniref:site-specific DNA-methyltransferase (adenine-specific) n=1 Tax=Thermoleptolyngbya sichuanensis A183 TaxID=2737172 RepID=A0A6M8BF79_9CYAN|nr:hypothetical protein HPC62_16210 [Thermoleptolyngbya sichuanensis A183]
MYYQNRDRFNHLIASGLDWTLESALLLYYLNRTGFNGLVRFSKSGVYNVPYGHYRKINYREDFSPWRSPMQGWVFTSADFAAVQLVPTDFVYADPPYDSVADDSVEQLSLLGVEHQGQAGDGFVGYSGAFGWGDQVRLARHLAQHPGPVLVSNAATHRIVQLYRDLGFEVMELGVRRSISCKGDRPMASEIFAFKEGKDRDASVSRDYPAVLWAASFDAASRRLLVVHAVCSVDHVHRDFAHGARFCRNAH